MGSRRYLAFVSAAVALAAAGAARAAPPVTFVQVADRTFSSFPDGGTLAFNAPTVRGNTIVVGAAWNPAAGAFSISDSAGNTYVRVQGPLPIGGWSTALFLAANVDAGPTPLQLHFDAPGAQRFDLAQVEYAGADPVDPFWLSGSGSGVGVPDAGLLISLVPGARALMWVTSSGAAVMAAPGWASRSAVDGDLFTDRDVEPRGPYGMAAAPSVPSWTTLLAVLRPPSDGGTTDAGLSDAGLSDAGLSDGGLTDAGLGDGGLSDAGLTDAGEAVDAGPETDAGTLPTGPLHLAVGAGCGCRAGPDPGLLWAVCALLPGLRHGLRRRAWRRNVRPSPR